MSTNVSKQKREDLLAKIKAIRTYIATAPQDENTANLLAYLSELEKDVGAKKYGLVFEEHREEIDEVLSTHTPVLMIFFAYPKPFCRTEKSVNLIAFGT